MQNIKTGIVVALLLAVCYGAFKALNEPEAELPPELNEWVSKEGSLDAMLDDVQLGDSSSLPTIETELPTIPGAGSEAFPPAGSTFANAPSAPATKPEPKKTDPINSKALILDTSANAVTKGADGPAVKIPSNTETAGTPSDSDSLVPDTFPSIPTADPKTALAPGAADAAAATPKPADSTADATFPSIPLPGGSTNEKTHLLVNTNSDASSNSNTLLPDAIALPGATTGASDASSSTKPAEQPVLEPFATAKENALKLAKDGKLKEALVMLTPQFRNPVISSSEHSDLLEILDALSREVIFSSRHLLKPAYTATATDTVESVATMHKITPELLTSINQLGNAKALVKGQQLKVLEGPFRGEVDLNVGEVTLFLNDMYACRFPITVGNDPVTVGTYEVADKRRDRTFFAPGKVIEARNPSNPYGGYWIDLGQNVCLHGSPEMETADLKNAGCISLAPRDIADAYIMLTQGSQVTIRR